MYVCVCVHPFLRNTCTYIQEHVKDFLRRHRNKRRTSTSTHDPKFTTTALADAAEIQVGIDAHNHTGGSVSRKPDLRHRGPGNRDSGKPDPGAQDLGNRDSGNPDPGATSYGDTDINSTRLRDKHPGILGHAKTHTDTGPPRLDETQYTPKELWARTGFIRDTHDTSSAENSNSAEHDKKTRFDKHNHDDERSPWGTRDHDLTTVDDGLHTDSESEGDRHMDMMPPGMDENVHDAAHMRQMYGRVFQQYMQSTNSRQASGMDRSQVLSPAKRCVNKHKNERASGSGVCGDAMTPRRVSASKKKDRHTLNARRGADGDGSAPMDGHGETRAVVGGEEHDMCIEGDSNRRSNSVRDDSESLNADGNQEAGAVDERLHALQNAIKAANAPFDLRKLSMKEAFVFDSSEITSSKSVVDENHDESYHGDDAVRPHGGDDDEDDGMRSRGNDVATSRGDHDDVVRSRGDGDVPGASSKMPRDHAGGTHDTDAHANSEREEQIRSRGHDGFDGSRGHDGVDGSRGHDGVDGSRGHGDVDGSRGHDGVDGSRGHDGVDDETQNNEREGEFDDQTHNDGKEREFDDETRERAYFLRRDVLFAQQYDDIVKHFEEQLRYVCEYRCSRVRVVCIHAFTCERWHDSMHSSDMCAFVHVCAYLYLFPHVHE
jgi:hypothetical protein